MDALFAAQTSVGLVLGGVLWHQRMRPRLATAALVVAIALAVIAPLGCAPFAESRLLHAVGVVLGGGFAKPALKAAAALTTAAALLTRRRPLITAAVLGQALLWPITDYVQDCDGDLAVAHLAFIGLLVGLHLRLDARGNQEPRQGSTPPPDGSEAPGQVGWRDEALAFVAGTLAGVMVCRFVFHGWYLGPDEGGNTYEAALFSKLHAYDVAPRCTEAFRFYVVYIYDGRVFAQYTPGWPYFMTPFMALGIPWLAGPSALGLLAAGVMRLARRAAEPATARVAGRLAAAAVLLSSTLLINGGSRYPHVFVAAMFAWALEALCAACAPATPAREQLRWSLLLGVTAGLLLAARPLDGGTLGLGLAACFAAAMASAGSADSRRPLWRAFLTAAIPFSIIGALTLVILRLQLGTWFKTGYSVTGLWFPWFTYGWSIPRATDFRWGIPLAAGSYCWWPCSPAVGLAGMALLRGPARKLGLAFFVACGALVIGYMLTECGRWIDFGYGPRYQLPCTVPMAVGTGVVLARLWRALAQSRWRQAGPVALSFGGALAGVLLIAPLVYPYTRDDVLRRNWARIAIADSHVHHAVVFGESVPQIDVHDLAVNLPLSLYPDQDVVLAMDADEDSVSCVRQSYPDRALYRVVRGEPPRVVPILTPEGAASVGAQADRHD
jgi:hypothetical protein